jgi:hypothetical protein
MVRWKFTEMWTWRRSGSDDPFGGAGNASNFNGNNVPFPTPCLLRGWKSCSARRFLVPVPGDSGNTNLAVLGSTGPLGKYVLSLSHYTIWRMSEGSLHLQPSVIRYADIGPLQRMPGGHVRRRSRGNSGPASVLSASSGGSQTTHHVSKVYREFRA